MRAWIMAIRRAWLLCAIAACAALAACSSDPPPAHLDDPCVDVGTLPLVVGGTAQLGTGDEFTPLQDGQDVYVVPDAQYFYMFVVTARTTEMHLGTGELQGVVEMTAYDDRGVLASLQVGCRLRDFTDNGDGSFDLAEPFGIALQPAFDDQLEGATMRLVAVIRDIDGHQAIDQHTVVAHFPAALPPGTN